MRTSTVLEDFENMKRCMQQDNKMTTRLSIWLAVSIVINVAFAVYFIIH